MSLIIFKTKFSDEKVWFSSERRGEVWGHFLAGIPCMYQPFIVKRNRQITTDSTTLSRSADINPASNGFRHQKQSQNQPADQSIETHGIQGCLFQYENDIGHRI